MMFTFLRNYKYIDRYIDYRERERVNVHNVNLSLKSKLLCFYKYHLTDLCIVCAFYI